MRSSIVVSSLAALLLVGFSGAADAVSLAGTWSGSGYVKPKSGSREKVRCRVTYRRLSKKVFGVVAKCASTSNTIRQTGKVLRVNANRYVGDFYNSQFDVSGRIRVTISGSRQTVSFSGKAGSGRVTLRKR